MVLRQTLHLMMGRLDKNTNDLAGDWLWDHDLLQALPLGSV